MPPPSLRASALVAAILLSLSASLSWGVADFLAGLKSRTLAVVSVMLVAVVTGLLLAGLVVAIRGVEAPATPYLVLGALSAVVGSIGLAAFYRGLAVGSMSVVAPIAATGAGVPVVFGLASGERPSLIQAVGAGVAIVGVVLAAREHGPAPPEGTGTARDLPWRLAPGAGLAIVAALGLGSFLVAIDAASAGDFGWAVLVNRGVSLVLLALAAVLLRPAPPTSVRDAAPAVAVGVLETSANLLIAVASTLGLVSLVGVVASLYPVATVALARVVLGERIARVQAVGAAAALSGVVLIAGGG
jgi:drug/metabolite transporter (DMT)-like permease